MLFANSCKKDSVKSDANQEQKISTNTTKDSIVPEKENTVTEKEVKLTSEERKKLNIFFSNFSEVDLKPFQSGGITEDELIKFGVMHNYINNFKLFDNLGEGNMRLKEDAVSKSIEKYFGKTVSRHKPVYDIRYKNGNYYIQAADGGAYIFSQVKRLVDIGNDRYIAYVNVYSASSGWTGDEHASPEQWNDAYDNPELSGKFKATFSKTNGPKGESVYTLIEYLKQ
jgi:hypothetical protein